ncbi:MAG: hypothetical protein H7Y42_14005 [Chitinophagaceae bacterium]|nr:hypothetical protein [Chitinophagaceae bacterium]
MKEIILLICTVVGTILTWMTFKKAFVDELKESRQLLLEKFELLQKINSGLIFDLTKYGNEQNSFDLIYMQGLSLHQCIGLLDKVRNTVLTTDNYEAIKKSKSKLRIEELKKGLDTQIQHHTEIQTYHNFTLK